MTNFIERWLRSLREQNALIAVLDQTTHEAHNVRRRQRCWRCNRGDGLTNWHATITLPPSQGGQIVARRDTWDQAMEAARGWTGPGQRAYVHRSVR